LLESIFSPSELIIIGGILTSGFTGGYSFTAATRRAVPLGQSLCTRDKSISEINIVYKLTRFIILMTQDEECQVVFFGLRGKSVIGKSQPNKLILQQEGCA
jgi:hypothetical protein